MLFTAKVKYLTSMSVGNEKVDVYNFDINNKKGTTVMLRNSFVPVVEVFEQEYEGSKIALNFFIANCCTLHYKS